MDNKSSNVQLHSLSLNSPVLSLPHLNSCSFSTNHVSYTRGDPLLPPHPIPHPTLSPTPRPTLLCPPSSPYTPCLYVHQPSWCSYFGDLALDVLREAYTQDVARATSLLCVQQPAFGGCTCIHLAYIGRSRGFLAHLAAQHIVDRVWRGHIGTTVSAFRVFPHPPHSAIGFQNS